MARVTLDLTELDQLSVEAVEQRKVELREDVKSIEMQLGDCNKTDVEGHRLSSNEWNEWRHKAVGALRFKREEYS